jgi:hypothetical protein
MKPLKILLRKSVNNGSEDMNKILERFNMNYDEFLTFYTEREKKERTILKWKANVIKKISNDEMDKDEVNVENNEFASKYNEYKQSENPNTRYKLLIQLQDIYINYLKNKSKIEYIK